MKAMLVVYVVMMFIEYFNGGVVLINDESHLASYITYPRTDAV